MELYWVNVVIYTWGQRAVCLHPNYFALNYFVVFVCCTLLLQNVCPAFVFSSSSPSSA